MVNNKKRRADDGEHVKPRRPSNRHMRKRKIDDGDHVKRRRTANRRIRKRRIEDGDHVKPMRAANRHIRKRKTNDHENEEPKSSTNRHKTIRKGKTNDHDNEEPKISAQRHTRKGRTNDRDNGEPERSANRHIRKKRTDHDNEERKRSVNRQIKKRKTGDHDHVKRRRTVHHHSRRKRSKNRHCVKHKERELGVDHARRKTRKDNDSNAASIRRLSSPFTAENGSIPTKNGYDSILCLLNYCNSFIGGPAVFDADRKVCAPMKSKEQSKVDGDYVSDDDLTDTSSVVYGWPRNSKTKGGDCDCKGLKRRATKDKKQNLGARTKCCDCKHREGRHRQ